MSPAVPPDSTQTGSPVQGEPDFLVVGRLGRPHGVRGEIQFRVMDEYSGGFRPGETVYIGEEKTGYRIAGLRGAGVKRILALDGVSSRDLAGRLRNRLVYVRMDTLPPLPEGEFNNHELIGMRVLAENGSELGVLAEIILTGANDVFVVNDSSGRERLLPAIDDVLREIDPQERTILVRLLPGL